MPELTQDANQAGTSSAPATQTDANATAGSSTTVTNDVAKQAVPTLQDVIGKALGNGADSTTAGTATPAAATTSQVGGPQGQENTAEADAAKLAEEKQKEELPFHNHPRWKEMLAERDTYKTEVEGLKTRVETAEQVVNDLSGYLAETGMAREEFDQTLEVAKLFKTGNMVGFLEAVMPLVQQAQMFTGEYLTPEVQAKVDAGLIDPESAKLIVTNQAQADLARQKLEQHNQKLEKQQQEQQAQQAKEAQEKQLADSRAAFTNAHEKWMATNRATEPAFATLERAIMAEAVLQRNLNPAAVTGPEVWVSLLEQAKKVVIDREIAAAAANRRPITPITPAGNYTSNGVVNNAPAKSLKERLEQVVGPSVG